ncbi:dihydrofolate reductase family protein [Rothia sp. AR01]|uniref:Dihydrofolate reductase family protein n=1 Tax=Rothia santali TaxID=2949643 RepID=A0A9X2KKU2_9MICC|nr:dihydrofolate reductase family protein [Rothia santali]MCP3425411.1 dihydrofolate reductase family protein [Rothia santali]
MRIVITQNMTLDGRIEMLTGWFDPSRKDEDLAEEIREQSAREAVLLLGRQTFTDFRSYWPLQTDDPTGVAEHLNRIDKRVISRTLGDPEWENTTVLAEDPLEVVRGLREEPGDDVVVTGSITLAHALIEADLVDEYRIFTYPVWQGRGRGFFPDDYEVPPLGLLRATSFLAGVTYAAYEPERRP